MFHAPHNTNESQQGVAPHVAQGAPPSEPWRSPKNNIMNEEKRSWLSESIIATAVPLMGYVLAFCYQSGYAGYFNIPREIISISMPQILLSTTGLVLYGYSLLWLSEIIFSSIPINARRDPIIRRTARLAPVTLLLFVSLNMYGLQSIEWIIFLIILIIQLFWEFVVPQLVQTRTKPYIEKLTAEWEDRDRKRNLGIIASLEGIVGFNITRYFLALVLIMYIASSWGGNHAIHCTNFYVDTSRTNTVILAIYDSRCVSSTYNPTNHSVSSDITITELSAACPLNIKKERIGPLSVINTD